MVNIVLLKELRERTGLSLMDCKNALVVANGDLVQAETELKKRGYDVAKKKNKRETVYGVFDYRLELDCVWIVGVCCETDYVSKNEKFRLGIKQLLDIVIEHKVVDVKQIEYVEAIQKAKASMIHLVGENIVIGHISAIKIDDDEVVGTYIHTGSGNAIGVIKLSGIPTKLKEKAIGVANILAMQVFAREPVYISKEDVPKDVITDRKQQALFGIPENKPQAVLDKIVAGRLDVFFEEVCLLQQEFIKDDSLSVKDWLYSMLGNMVKVSFMKKIEI